MLLPTTEKNVSKRLYGWRSAMQRIKRKKNPLQGECWREKQIACHIPSHSTFNRFCNFRLCRGGWFTDMKMFHMPSVCFWNRTVSRLGTLGPCCGCFQSAVWEILRQPYNKVGQTWIIFDVYPSFFSILCFVFLPGTCPFFGTTLAEDFIPSALGRQSDATHMCRANFIATCARWKPWQRPCLP